MGVLLLIYRDNIHYTYTFSSHVYEEELVYIHSTPRTHTARHNKALTVYASTQRTDTTINEI